MVVQVTCVTPGLEGKLAVFFIFRPSAHDILKIEKSKLSIHRSTYFNVCANFDINFDLRYSLSFLKKIYEKRTKQARERSTMGMRGSGVEW